jgi:2OG-Fe(II) oxygenase superfamily
MQRAYLAVGNTNTQIFVDSEQVKPVYGNQRALLCRNAVDLDLLARLAKAATKSNFVSDTIDGLGHRWIESPSVVGAAIQLMLNRSNLQEWLKAVTACTAKGRFEGRLVKSQPGGEDRLGWHSDTMPDARYEFGLTLHLRPCLYKGGAFEMRDQTSKKPLFKHVKAEAGDLLIFEVNPRTEHRVSPVASGEPRLVFTGWFIADPID